MHLGIRLVLPAALALPLGARRGAGVVGHQGHLRPGLSDRDGVAGRGRDQEGLLRRHRRRDRRGLHRGVARHAGGRCRLARYHAQHLQRGDLVLEVGRQRRPSALVSMCIHPGVVVGRKGIKSAGELKGKVIGTSSIKSGSTILLRRLLKARGLSRPATCGRRPGQRTDFQRPAGRCARCGVAGAAAVLSPRAAAFPCSARSARWRRNSPSCASSPTLRGSRRTATSPPLRQGVARGGGVAVRSRQPRRGRAAPRRRTQGAPPTPPPPMTI